MNIVETLNSLKEKIRNKKKHNDLSNENDVEREYAYERLLTVLGENEKSILEKITFSPEFVESVANTPYSAYRNIFEYVDLNNITLDHTNKLAKAMKLLLKTIDITIEQGLTAKTELRDIYAFALYIIKKYNIRLTDEEKSHFNILVSRVEYQRQSIEEILTRQEEET